MMPHKQRFRTMMHGGVILTTATILALPLPADAAKRPPNGKQHATTQAHRGLDWERHR